MKLYEVPRNTKIKVLGNIKVPPGAPKIYENETINFHHIDGMYSYCTKEDGTVVHLVAWANVKIINET